MITPAYESKVKSGWNKVLKFWDGVIKFIQKKINEFTSFIKNIFTKKTPENNKNSEVKSKDAKNVNNSEYDEYCKVPGNLYLLCVNINKMPTEINHYITNIRKNPDYIYYLEETLEAGSDYMDNPDEFVSDYLCTASTSDKNHLNEDWIIPKDRLSTLANYFSQTKDEIISIKKKLENFDPNTFGNEYSKIQNSMILCGKFSSKLISKACEIKNNVSSVSQDDFDNLYHKF